MQTACAGVLIAEANRRRGAQAELGSGPETSKHEIRSIEQFCLSQYMYINTSAMSSLQILDCDASSKARACESTSRIGSPKGAISIYGLIHGMISTPQGRTYLRKFLFRPSRHLPTIVARHRAIEVLLHVQNTGTVKQITKALKKIKDMKKILPKLLKGTGMDSTTQSSRGGLWVTLSQFAGHVTEAQQLIGLLSGHESSEIICYVSSLCVCNLPRLTGSKVSRLRGYWRDGRCRMFGERDHRL